MQSETCVHTNQALRLFHKLMLALLDSRKCLQTYVHTKPEREIVTQLMLALLDGRMYAYSK